MQDAQYASAFDGYLQALVLGAGEPNATSSLWHPQKLDTVFQEAKRYEDTAFAPLALYWMGVARLKLGDKAAAIEYCQKAFDKAAMNEELANKILLRMLSSLGEKEVSIYFEQKLAANPDSLEANLTMYNLAKIKGEYSKAKDYIGRCIKLAGPNDQRKDEYLLRKAELLIVAYELTSDNSYLKEAIADYESLLTKMPNNTNVLNNLAYMLAENNQRLSDALEYAKKVFEQKPNNPNFMDTYAYVLYKNGQNSKAAELLTAAMQQYQQDVIATPSAILEHLGMVEEKLGEKAQALAAYKQVLQIGADKLPKNVKQRIQSAIERLSR
jgi:tetratricopeptide (TPR) repeat protein